MKKSVALVGLPLAAAGVAAAAVVAGPAGESQAGAFPPFCGSEHLTAQAQNSDVGMGHRAVMIEIKNSGQSTCSVHGYPALTALDAGGHDLGLPTAHGDTSFGRDSSDHLVALRPGENATFSVSWTSPAVSGEPPVHVEDVEIGLADVEGHRLKVHLDAEVARAGFVSTALNS